MTCFPHTSPAQRHATALRLRLAHLATAIVGLLTLCACERSPFECARKLGSNSEDISRCDRPREVCVCATRQCAIPAASTECPSGYRYAESPFGNDRQCVPKTETQEGFADKATGQCSETSTDGGAQ
jgi:hypothetical protein